jgi:hypothetical protein
MDNTPLKGLGGAAALGLAIFCLCVPFIFPKFPRWAAIIGVVAGLVLMGWQWITALPDAQALSFRVLLKDYTGLLWVGVGIGVLSLAGLWWVLSASPVAQIEYAKKPLSLRVLYDTDFDYKGYWTELPLDGKDGTKITVPWRVVEDHNARSMFLVFYIPAFNDADKAIGLCKFIALHHADIVENEKPHMAELISPNPGESSPVLIKDLVFTGTIYLYIADQLSTVQEADIYRLCESEKLSAVIHSEYYRLVHAQEDRVDPFQQPKVRAD